MVLAVLCFLWVACIMQVQPGMLPAQLYPGHAGPGHWCVPMHSLKISKLMHLEKLCSECCSQGANNVPTATAFAFYSLGVWGCLCWLPPLPMAAAARCQWLLSPSLVGPRWCWGTSSRRKGGGKPDAIPIWQNHWHSPNGLGKAERGVLGRSVPAWGFAGATTNDSLFLPADGPAWSSPPKSSGEESR